MSDILDPKAKPVAKAKTPVTDVTVDPKRFPKFKALLTNYDFHKLTIKTNTDSLKLVDKEIKDVGVELYSELYESKGENPGSLRLIVDDKNITLIPADAYNSIDENQALELQKKYPGSVTQETTIAFNNEMLTKYKDVLAKMFNESKEISEEDKPNLFTKTTNYSVAKGSIDRMKEMGKVSEVLQSLKPALTIKKI